MNSDASISLPKLWVSKSKLGLQFFGLGLGLFLMDFPLVGPVTTSRLGFISVLAGFFLGLKEYRFPILGKNKLKRLYFPILFFIAATFISSLYYRQDATSLTSWLFTLLSLYLVNTQTTQFEKRGTVLHAATFTSFLFVFSLFTYSLLKFGILASSSFNMRFSINELGPGLSRIVNGIVFSNLIIYLYYIVRRSRRSFLLVVFSLGMSLWFVFSSHSRQGMLLLVFVMLAFLLEIYQKTRFKKTFILFVLIAFSFISVSVLNSSAFQERFIQRTVEQAEKNEGSTAERIYFYIRGTELFLENPIFGIGPKNFIPTVGLDAHSGYLLETTETGILALIGIVFFTLGTFSLIGFNIKRGHGFANSMIIFTLLLAPFFNSILNSPMFWTTAYLIFSFTIEKRSD